MKNFTWYAVERNSEDNDWGYGSFDFDEAVKMAKAMGPAAQIAVISGWADSMDDELQDTECTEVLTQDDFE